MIGWIIWFFVTPVILWKDWKTISELGETDLVVCIVFYVTFGVGFFLWFLHRYKKIASELEK